MKGDKEENEKLQVRDDDIPLMGNDKEIVTTTQEQKANSNVHVDAQTNVENKVEPKKLQTDSLKDTETEDSNATATMEQESPVVELDKSFEQKIDEVEKKSFKQTVVEMEKVSLDLKLCLVGGW